MCGESEREWAVHAEDGRISSAKLVRVTPRPDPLLGYAVHFTRGRHPADAARALDAPLPGLPSHQEVMRFQQDVDTTGYWSSLSILWTGEVRPARDPLGIAATLPQVGASQRAACFSATRLDKLKRLREKRSLYGVGFTLDRLAVFGGRAVQYLQPGSPQADRAGNEIRRRTRAGIDPADPFWKTTVFIDPD